MNLCKVILNIHMKMILIFFFFGVYAIHMKMIPTYFFFGVYACAGQNLLGLLMEY